MNVTKEEIIYMYNHFKIYLKSLKNIKCKHRKPNFPEHISENLISYIINKLFINGEVSNKSNKGDLMLNTGEKIECKTFSSKGPMSFGPNEIWKYLYILDAKDLDNDKITLYKVNMSNIDFKTIKVNKLETYEQQCLQKRRPRITWELLLPQVIKQTTIIYTGSIYEI